MNSFISHRLYVAAVANVPSSTGKTARNETAFTKTPGIASAIPLELMQAAKALPMTAVRRLRSNPAGARS
jgi:hypothetical protein